ncbi:MAG: hypothetical protein A3B04_01355 [Candidatus Portnoybacteria bacterium RIFCSPLOWO2_02_FULL_39_11]|uniref:DUF559 domain-containing protein n=1 Tax=Candidatus Portnoybacteria bacterium RIFCSPLOWO2_02_FULL_39_11 TaxID=1802001 RepID=A0A1G2FU97_9BACT|nr:MAG: hypothetical protein A3B04_01355 [Candidatus Portnoybacteria bacterium RIFCSPLOWO2_02_FULL_39_11]
MIKAPRNKSDLKSVRSILRANMPLPEVILWQRIRGHKLGLKFRRQYSVENHILDFFAPAIKLGIEIDGDTHFRNKQAEEKDFLRDRFLKEQGIIVLRFTNNEVRCSLDSIIYKIESIIKNAHPLLISPSRVPEGERRSG